MAKTKKDAVQTYEKLNVVTMGGKGGTGKTTFMTGLVDYFESNKIPMTLIDLDIENQHKGGLRNYFSRAEKVDAHSRDALDVFFDVSEADEPVVIADMGAGQGDVAKEWFGEKFNLAAELRIGFLFVGMITEDPASVTSVLDWVSVLQDKVSYLVVCNEMATKNAPFEYWHAAPKAKEFRDRFHPAVITLHSRAPQIQNYLSDHSLTLRDVLERNPKIGPLDHVRNRSNAKHYRDRLFAQLDAVIPPLLPGDNL